MPRFDGTGPSGSGPRTGWGMGPCGDGTAYGRRFWGRGRGLGWRRYSPVSKKEEEEALSDEAGVLEEELKAIKARLSELKKQK